MTAIFFGVPVFILARSTAQTATNDTNPLLEPGIAVIAFAAWALASPGTFLAAFLKATDLAGATGLTAIAAAAALFVASQLLKKPKPRPVAT